VLTNLRGYDVRRRIIKNPNARWFDQHNKLDHLHTLEKKVFERSIEVFSDTRYGYYVLDDELVGFKANDLENKTISDRKSAGEGTTTECSCDTFFQIVLGIRIKTIADSQLKTVQRLLDYLPQIEDNTMPMLGPIIACDCGYGKKAIIELLSAKNFKVLTIAGTVGSGHPINGTMAVDQYCSKIREHNSLSCGNSNMEISYGILQTELSPFLDSIKEISISDDPTLLLGPEVVTAKCNRVSMLYAYAYRDIFDKKMEQKILGFYVSGFPNVGFLLKTWVCVPKATSCPFKCLFVGNQDQNTDVVERVIEHNAYALTMAQRTADWFTL
jgi:hypothetical protein